MAAIRLAVIELLAAEDEPLLLWWNPLLVLYLRLHVGNRIPLLHIDRHRLPGQGLDKDLIAASPKRKQGRCAQNCLRWTLRSSQQRRREPGERFSGDGDGAQAHATQ